jgi:hypothetical protein
MIKLLDILKEIKVQPVSIGDNTTFKDWVNNNIYNIIDFLCDSYNLEPKNLYSDKDDWDIYYTTKFDDKIIPKDKIYVMSNLYSDFTIWLSEDDELMKYPKNIDIQGKKIFYIIYNP